VAQLDVKPAVAFAAITECGAAPLPQGMDCVCGICEEGPDDCDFPKCLNGDGEEVSVGTACVRHWRVYSRTVRPMGLSWKQLCGQYHSVLITLWMSQT
jgi:hypothetical protein